MEEKRGIEEKKHGSRIKREKDGGYKSRGEGTEGREERKGGDM